MQPIFVLLILLILMAATAAAIAGVVIYKRKGRQGVKSMLAGEDRPIKQEKVPVEEEPQPNSDDAQLQTAQRTDLMALPEPPATVLSEAQVWKAQTPEPTGTEEAKHPLAKEAQECTRPSRHVATAGEETKQTVIDVIQPPTREETESPAKEPLQPPETEESRETKLPQTSEKPRKRRRVPPRDRGGRPRSYTQNREEVPAPTTVSYRPRPEIVCWKRERQWFIGVEAPDDLLENSDDLEIHQNGQSLSPDDYEETCWPLCSVGGQVTVKWKEKDASQSFTLTVDQEGYLLFKLSGQDLNKGRLVKSVSSGSYLVITPDTWERDETIAGPPPVAPEPVALDGYLAHFFELEKSTDTEIAFCTPEAVPISISSRAARFELIGEKVEDASEKMGPLFIKPPRIRAVVPNPQGWKGIKTIVVGEEGSGRGRWRTQFSPDPKHTDQDLPSEVLARKGGWYFLRFYNRNDDLVESLDFRFLSGLNRIEMPESSPLPSNDGHQPARVQISHETAIILRPVEDLPNLAKREDGSTILTLPADPKYDLTRWLIGYEDGPQIEVTILVERVWWVLGEEGNEPSQWRDAPLTLSRDDFTPTSEKAIWLRLPKNRWVDTVFVGFKRAKRRSYPVRVTEKTLTVPLREFADAEEVAERVREHRLRIWIERNGEYEAVVAILPAEERVPPSRQWVGVGRYKTALARTTLQDGSGNITVNGKNVREYFKRAPAKARRFLQRLQSLPQVRDVLSRLDAHIEVWGSNPTTMRQAKAVAHALARAVMNYNPELKPVLKRAGFGGIRVSGNR